MPEKSHKNNPKKSFCAQKHENVQHNGRGGGKKGIPEGAAYWG